MEILRNQRQPPADLETGKAVATSSASAQTKSSVPTPTREETKREFDDPISSDFEDQVKAFSIRECQCFPHNETIDECKARIMRVVGKQKRCYSIETIPYTMISNL